MHFFTKTTFVNLHDDDNDSIMFYALGCHDIDYVDMYFSA